MDCHWYFPLFKIGELSQTFKSINPDVDIVIGGQAATIFSDMVIRSFYVDYIVLGDAEKPFPMLIDKLLKSEDISDVPNILTREHSTGQTYSTTREDFDNMDYVNVDWFPAFKNRMATQHCMDEVSGGDVFGTYPFICVYKGCVFDCDFCFANKKLQKYIYRRGFVARSSESVRMDLERCSDDPKIRKVFLIADFLSLLGEAYTSDILVGREYNLNLHYSFNEFAYCDLKSIGQLVSSFKHCNLYFAFSKHFHRYQARRRFDYLSTVIGDLARVYGNKVAFGLYVLDGDAEFDVYYEGLGRISRNITFISHRNWLLDLPYPKDSIDREEWFAEWLGKSRRMSSAHLLTNVDKDKDKRNLCSYVHRIQNRRIDGAQE